MGIRIRLTRQTLAVVEALLAGPNRWHHGYAISRRTGIASGTLYPILMRLDKLGWLETRWENGLPCGRPRRHLYCLSGSGYGWAKEELRFAREQKFWTPALEQV
jgi:PadR family transcriptional regulator, regulatory protein PadR